MENSKKIDDTIKKLFHELSKESLSKKLLTFSELAQGVENVPEIFDLHAYMRQKSFTTGCRGLDGLLGGGIETGAITEFVGEFATGKTQIAHQLAVTVQLPLKKKGLNAKAIFIDTEGTFRPERIIQIAEYRGLNPEKTLKNILYARAYTSEELLFFIYKAVLYLENNVGLVVIDTLTSLNIEILSKEKRAAYESLIIYMMLRLLEAALAKKVAIVITNRGFMRGENFWVIGDPQISMLSSLRVHLEKQPGGAWTAKTLYSPHGKRRVCRFRITEKGLEDLA